MTVVKSIEVKNNLGLHLRADAELVRVMGKFASNVVIWKNQTSVNGKSLIGILSLAAAKGAILKFIFEGDDADKAASAIELFFKAGYE